MQVLIHSKTLFLKDTVTDLDTGIMVGVESWKDPIKLQVWDRDTQETFVPPKDVDDDEELSPEQPAPILRAKEIGFKRAAEKVKIAPSQENVQVGLAIRERKWNCCSGCCTFKPNKGEHHRIVT